MGQLRACQRKDRGNVTFYIASGYGNYVTGPGLVLDLLPEPSFAATYFTEEMTTLWVKLPLSVDMEDVLDDILFGSGGICR